jgi:hypothetical protein
MTEPQLREIQGYLDAFEQLNHGPDRECCFEFEQVAWRGDLQSSLEAHFETLPGAHPQWQLTLEKLTTGMDGLRSVVEPWFFGPTFGGAADLAKHVTPDARRACVGQWFSFLLDFFGGDHPAVWRIRLHATDEPAPTSADDFVLACREHVYWLHLDCAE